MICLKMEKIRRILHYQTESKMEYFNLCNYTIENELCTAGDIKFTMIVSIVDKVSVNIGYFEKVSCKFVGK